MGAKQSSEMREAMRLVAEGVTQTEAAAKAGVGRTSLVTAISRWRTATFKDKIKELRGWVDGDKIRFPSVDLKDQFNAWCNTQYMAASKGDDLAVLSSADIERIRRNIADTKGLK